MAENEKWAAYEKQLAADKERFDEIAASCRDSLAYYREQLEKALKKHEEKQQKTAEAMDGEMTRTKTELKGLKFLEFAKKKDLKKKLRTLRRQVNLLRNEKKQSGNREKNSAAIQSALEGYNKALDGYLAKCFPAMNDPEPKRDGQEPPQSTKYQIAGGFISMPQLDLRSITSNFI